MGLDPVVLKDNAGLANGFKGKGPTQLVAYWAGKHDGHVIIKDLAKALIAAGRFKKYRNAYSSINAVVRRKQYSKVKAGHFQMN